MVEAGTPSQEQHDGKSKKRKRTQRSKSPGKYDDLLEEAKKHEEEAEQALACAKKEFRQRDWLSHSLGLRESG